MEREKLIQILSRLQNDLNRQPNLERSKRYKMRALARQLSLRINQLNRPGRLQ